MNLKFVLVLASTVVCVGGHVPTVSAASGILQAQASSDSGYRVGDTLAPQQRGPAAGYEDIGWENLLPEGWSVEKMLDSLNLSGMEDNDPKAKEMLVKIRQMWDSAPANGKLDNKRVR